MAELQVYIKTYNKAQIQVEQRKKVRDDLKEQLKQKEKEVLVTDVQVKRAADLDE